MMVKEKNGAQDPNKSLEKQTPSEEERTYYYINRDSEIRANCGKMLGRSNIIIHVDKGAG